MAKLTLAQEQQRQELQQLTNSTEFGQAIIQAQLDGHRAYAAYNGQTWTIERDGEKVKQAEMSISLPRLDIEMDRVFLETLETTSILEEASQERQELVA